jgi:uncharacterized protein with HEPN domain
MFEREWIFYIDGMLRFAEQPSLFDHQSDLPGIVRGPLKFDAIVRNLELIGEAASVSLPMESADYR